MPEYDGPRIACYYGRQIGALSVHLSKDVFSWRECLVIIDAISSECNRFEFSHNKFVLTDIIYRGIYFWNRAHRHWPESFAHRAKITAAYTLKKLVSWPPRRVRPKQISGSVLMSTSSKGQSRTSISAGENYCNHRCGSVGSVKFNSRVDDSVVNKLT
ncbi:hypothetical protein BC936DRAFT_138002 [Jimgerdemannia flammicorona]|uniref:Uncharacterized protein n=1 Tax=Jimgerdemannia flammicorona TaxID=994334 RepID=A0A433CWB1_9FUNG|nr:hypothetical protein BC936DRAFT_138002 [Jimgerdemannia flammicorona]